MEERKRKRNYQIKTYQKNNISRSKKNDRNNKICRSDKKEYPYHLQRKLSCVQNGNNRKTWSSCSTCKWNCHMVCHWEERGKINLPIPLRVWINRPQRLTIKRRIWMAKVTNPVRMYGKLSALHNPNRLNREGGYGGHDSSPNEAHDRVRKKKEAKWLARTLKLEVVPFSSEEIGIKNSVFRMEVAVRGRADLMPKKLLGVSLVKGIEF